MENRIIITIDDYQKLVGLLNGSYNINKTPQLANQLSDKLANANKLKPDTISSKVVTMNSRVKLKDVVSKRELEVTITYPENAEPRERRISIFSEIGLSIFGRKENDIVSWKIPDGVGRFEIARVVYQPEAAGEFNL